MPKHTEAERAKNVRALIARPIDSFPRIERVERAIQRKKLNLKANPRSRPSIPPALSAPSSRKPIIRPTKIQDIPSGLSTIERLNKERELKLKRALR